MSSPFTLDLFEVALLIGSCFLVNYVTADNKTNWAEACKSYSELDRVLNIDRDML